MLAFGLGTLPAVLATGLLANQLTGLLQRRMLRTGFALLIIAFGIWTLIGGSHHQDHNHEHHHSSGQTPHPVEAVDADHTNHH